MAVGPVICHGKPTIQEMRITVGVVLNVSARGATGDSSDEAILAYGAETMSCACRIRSAGRPRVQSAKSRYPSVVWCSLESRPRSTSRYASFRHASFDHSESEH
ncbi:MAG: hypothetical protein BRD40_01265 [Bacteroidetes bacterium QS_1_65_9]|nr:MAG: hypothetical protein BRD40_01265 [Bacteroidetes bacterium QS_1_65_9]